MISLEVYVKCPFFLKETGKQIRCEGYLEGTCMTTSFPFRSDLIHYVNENCSHMDGGSCIMAKNLYEKYKRIEELERKKKISRASA